MSPFFLGMAFTAVFAPSPVHMVDRQLSYRFDLAQGALPLTPIEQLRLGVIEFECKPLTDAGVKFRCLSGGLSEAKDEGLLERVSFQAAL